MLTRDDWEGRSVIAKVIVGSGIDNLSSITIDKLIHEGDVAEAAAGEGNVELDHSGALHRDGQSKVNIHIITMTDTGIKVIIHKTPFTALFKDNNKDRKK
jgi:hypothetical protein